MSCLGSHSQESVLLLFLRRLRMWAIKKEEEEVWKMKGYCDIEFKALSEGVWRQQDSSNTNEKKRDLGQRHPMKNAPGIPFYNYNFTLNLVTSHLVTPSPCKQRQAGLQSTNTSHYILFSLKGLWQTLTHSSLFICVVNMQLCQSSQVLRKGVRNFSSCFVSFQPFIHLFIVLDLLTKIMFDSSFDNGCINKPRVQGIRETRTASAVLPD